ncbi:hypothetical protein Fmac_029089 [Flemingia macrophylla]|uniref:PWWP domain-containing protein n=1 Tax=Flemingia macrophylla TaxID=520843 RepID=A0ABD1LAT7_9FABA
MGTVEAQSKDPSGCSSPSPENDKNELREALCALKNGASENGVGFSGHGNQGFGDDGGVEVAKGRVFETNVLDETGSVGRKMEDDCQGLADSEMNGVSSLLKMRGSGSGRNLMFTYGGESDGAGKLNSEGGSLEVEAEEGRKDRKTSEGGDDQIGKTGTVGVPIAVTSENKDLEMDDLGDEGCEGFSVGDFVWGKIKSHPWWPGRIYDPSDASDFALKLRQKNRLLVAYFGDGTFAWCHHSQLKPFEENFEDMVKQSSSRAFVNAIQEAVNEVGRLLNLKMSSSFVANITRSEITLPLADNAGVKEGILIPENGIEKLSDILIDPAELLSRVKQITKIISIANILELEILKARLSAFYLSRGGYRLPMYEAPQPIPGLEDSLSDKTVNEGRSEGVVEAPVHGPFEDYSTMPVSPKSGELSLSQGILGNRLNHRIKQKSIAEIMGEDKDVNTKNKDGDATEKVTVRKKRKGSEDRMASKPVQKRKGLSPNTDGNMESAENDGLSWGKENSDNGTLAQLKKKKKAFGFGNTSSGSKKEADRQRKAEGETEKGSLSRERKKSKYLSPPFTIPSREQRKGEIETESPKVSGKEQVTEPVTRASDQVKSPVPLKLNSEAFQENFSKELATEQDLPDSSNYPTLENDENKTIDTSKIQVPSREVLSEVLYAAINPQTPTDINSLEKIVDFIFMYRSSLYRQGPYYKVYKKHKPSNKRKRPESDLGMPRKDQIHSDHISAKNDSAPEKRRRKNEITSGLPKEKRSSAAKTGEKMTDKNASGAALFVSFGPGSSLPSKSDLISLYSKFGVLNKSETALFSSDYTACVFFLKASDAEKALSHSQNVNPFGSSEATFRLQYLSSGSKSEKSKSKLSSSNKKEKTQGKPSTSLSPGSEASKLNYIKQKLQGLTSMLEASDGKSPEVKIKLESEMKELLEDVNKMVESSS